jgi:putative peptidoglycan lipid II flippase
MLSTFSIKAFYAMGDVKTPLLSSFASISMNVVLNFLFIGSLKHGGLALATSLSHWLGGVLLLWLLARKIGGIKVRPMLADAGKSLVASLLMGIVVYFVYDMLMPLMPSGRLWAAVTLAAVIGLGAAVYFLCAALLKAQGAAETKILIKRVWQRFSHAEQGGK